MPGYSSACDCAESNGDETQQELSLVWGLRQGEPHLPPVTIWGLHALGMFVEEALGSPFSVLLVQRTCTPGSQQLLCLEPSCHQKGLPAASPILSTDLTPARSL